MINNYSHLRTRSSRDHFMEPPTILARLLAALPTGLAVIVQRSVQKQSAALARLPRTLQNAPGRLRRRSVVNVPNVLIAIWVLVLLWGERWVFQSSIKACDWKEWERWPKAATPHHLILLADPQIVDPHTYTGRPWPLSTLTELHTDNYLRRTYKNLQLTLEPDTIFFLGDLFDGGREWATMRGDISDPDWQAQERPKEEAKLIGYWKKHYGEDFWMQEYERFGRIFFNLFNHGNPTSEPRNGQRGRKIIASLPGNHDLGFGAKIRLPVRDRFQAFFGDANRVDIIANHSIVSIDSVSLSAGADKSNLDNRDIYAPVDAFLASVRATKRRLLARELRQLRGESPNPQQAHVVQDVADLRISLDDLPSLDPGEHHAADLPTILLTHVPLYRNPGTPCGPLRERHPPTPPPPGQTTPVTPDERNAISVARGYQYQNVLSQGDTARVLAAVGNVQEVFSGDDHDYCEVVHDEGNSGAGVVGRVREVTVKSLSWAMGVRRPGFVMLSLWNPIDADGNQVGTRGGGHGAPATPAAAATIETHLCLLPDQLAIFFRYLMLLILSLLAVLVRAVLTQTMDLPPSLPPSVANNKDAPLLPTSRRPQPPQHRQSTSSTSSTSSTRSAQLAPRVSVARTRSASPGGYGLPPSQAARYVPPVASWEEEVEEEEGGKKVRWEGGEGVEGRGEGMLMGRVGREVAGSVWRVGWVVGVWFLWLGWRG